MSFACQHVYCTRLKTSLKIRQHRTMLPSILLRHVKLVFTADTDWTGVFLIIGLNDTQTHYTLATIFFIKNHCIFWYLNKNI